MRVGDDEIYVLKKDEKLMGHAVKGQRGRSISYVVCVLQPGNFVPPPPFFFFLSLNFENKTD